MSRQESRLPVPEDISWYKREFDRDPDGSPVPFLRRDILIDHSIGYTDGSENVLIPPQFLLQLNPAEYASLLINCGRLLDPSFVSSHHGPSPATLSHILEASDNPVYLIGSRARDLAHALDSPASKFGEDVILRERRFYRIPETDIRDYDYLVSLADINHLAVAFTGQAVQVRSSRTSPGGRILDVVTGREHLQFLAFPGINPLVDHIFGAIDYPDAVFAEVLPDNLLRLQDPVGAASMQPRFNHPPYPDYFLTNPGDNRLIRSAVMTAVTAGEQCPKATVAYLKQLGHLYAAGIWDGKIPEPAAESITEAYLSSWKKSPRMDPDSFRLLGETELLKIVIRSVIQNGNLFGLQSLYLEITNMFKHVKGYPDMQIFENFYIGHVSCLAPDQIKAALEKLNTVPASFYARLEFTKGSCYFDQSHPRTRFMQSVIPVQPFQIPSPSQP